MTDEIEFSEGKWHDLLPFGQWTELTDAVPPVRVMPMDVEKPGTKVLIRDSDGGIEPNGPVTIVELPTDEEDGE